MAYGNNRSGKQPRAHFQLAGGTVIKFKHPYLAGQLSGGSLIDEIDISACTTLDGRYFSANPNQDSAKQVVMIDGSTATITNKLLNGTITMPVVRTTGKVATGDFISALQLIKSVGDTVGGLLIKTDFRNGEAQTRVYYGVTPQRVPDDESEGNNVAVYNVSLLYAGYIDAISTTSDSNLKAIWAVGTEKGVSAYFTPYKLQNSDGNGGTASSYLTSAGAGITDKVDDDGSGNSSGTPLSGGKGYIDTDQSVESGATISVNSVGGEQEFKAQQSEPIGTNTSGSSTGN